FLNHKPPCTRSWQNFNHYVEVSSVLIRIRRAVAAQSQIVLNKAFMEHTVVNAAADLPPQKRYKLFTVTQEQPRQIVFSPDAGFELQRGEKRVALYLELERGSDSPKRVAARKASG